MLDSHWRKLFFLILLVLLLALLFWYSASFQEVFFGSVDFLEGYANRHILLAEGIFVGAAALSAMFSPFSSVPLVPAALVIWDSGLTLSLLLLGWLLGGIGAYLVGRYALYQLLRRVLDIDGKVDYYRKKISPRAEFGLVLLFRFAMPAEIPGYVLGAIRYHFGKYFLATFLAEFPFAVITVYASEALIFKEPVLLGALGLLVTLILGGALYFFRKKLRD